MSNQSDRLVAARKAAGFVNAADAARALGVAYPTYAGHENGSRGFLRHAEAYARRFKVRRNWLWHGTGPMRGRQEPPYLEGFLALSPEKQQQVLDYIDFLLGKERGEGFSNGPPLEHRSQKHQ